MHTLVIHPSSARAFGVLQRNNQQADASMARPSCPDRSSHIVGPYTVGDPLFTPIDNILVALPHRCSLDVRHVTTGIWLCDSQAEP